MFKLIIIATLALGACATVGCSSLGAKAYQRGTLAKESMQLDSDSITTGFDDHIYFSKEASSGGASFGGGGCGCN
jgi:hypothetical protein